MIPTRRMERRSGASGCSVPTAASAAVVAGAFPSSSPGFCRGTPSPQCCSGNVWFNGWRGFPSRRRRKSCGCPLRWKQFTGFGADCTGGWMRCAPGFAGNIPHRPAARLIPCAKRWNISKPSCPPVPVHRRIFNGIFSRPSWVEVRADGHRGFVFCRITTADFFSADFSCGRQHDNTISPVRGHPIASPA